MDYFAPLSRRIKALMIDGLLIALWLFLAILVVSKLGINNSKLESLLILFVVVSIEPLLLSLTGSTVGQHLCGIRVRRIDSDKKLNILLSTIRTLLKLPFGILSLATVSASERHQGIHDFISRSIVVHKSPESAPVGERLKARIKDTENYRYPSVIRRVFVIFLYLLISIIVVAILPLLFISESCFEGHSCSDIDGVINIGFSLLFYISVFVIIALAWQARLWGCRKRAIKTEEGSS
ncbi:RDD family protein [uncultured Pseudoteredinibacter sp.]|uniref:RDD family protein n=1 Tax=uncultured Pseudoteredinibacter sp. TaxID=1641701 RepID=UPI00263297FA|nr:RDD family protein [uncultured Pseudoteredinibacter sp.]